MSNSNISELLWKGPQIIFTNRATLSTRIKFPEQDMVIRMVNRLFSHNFLKFILVTEGFNLIEISPDNEQVDIIYEIKLRAKPNEWRNY